MAVGESVGTVVGATVGPIDVGLADGIHVCPVVVGERVGDAVGEVGTTVGELVGCPEVGNAVGAAVGAVGKLVGDKVRHAPHVFRQFEANTGLSVKLQFAFRFSGPLIICMVEQKPL